METILFNELKKYVDDKIIRYDVPGHKGNNLDFKFSSFFGENIIKADVNSMERLDNLNFSKSIIKQTQQNIAKVHKAMDSRMLVNGTTIGIQAMILSSLNPGEEILIPTNVHKSIESAIILSGAKAIYVDVEFDQDLLIYTSLTLKKVQEKIEEFSNIKAVLLINPSYYGISYKFEEIVKYLKGKNKIVLVDEAHGGHFYFGDKTLKNAMEVGADMSCVSYHKTLGSLTQTSLLLHNSNIISIEVIDKVLGMLNSTSPSYLFMTSLECTIANIVNNLENRFDETILELDNYKKQIDEIKGIKVVDSGLVGVSENNFDKLRLVIHIKSLSISGFELYEILRDKYKIQLELGEYKVVVAIITIYDNLNLLNKLIQALKEISKEYYEDKKSNVSFKFHKLEYSDLTLRESFYKEKELVNIKDSIGKICGDSIMLYPPGISIIRQGQYFNKEIIDYIISLKNANIHILGMTENNVCVLKGKK